MIAWLEEKRDKIYCDLVCMVPFSWFSQLVIDLKLKRFMVRHLKPTQCFRVYDMDINPPRLCAAYPYRWARWVAAKKATWVADMREPAVVLDCKTYISEDGEDRFPILRQIDPSDFKVVYDNTKKGS